MLGVVCGGACTEGTLILARIPESNRRYNLAIEVSDIPAGHEAGFVALYIPNNRHST